VIQFPPDGNIYLCCLRPPFKLKAKWRHESRRDAEFIFWLQFWCDIRPCLSALIHHPFHSKCRTCSRVKISPQKVAFFPISIRLSWIYYMLRWWLYWGKWQDTLDFWWTKEEHLRNPEFVHEAFQRLISNFLLECDGASFMGPFQSRIATGLLYHLPGFFSPSRLPLLRDLNECSDFIRME